jgi:diguanylate cyclase (GGDEF)-like protein
MFRNSKKLSLSSQGLKYKLKISFYLMSILPLLVCIYLVSNYIVPLVGLKLDILTSIVVSVFIAVIGLFVIKEVFDRVISVTSEAKLIAAGDIAHRVEIDREDEIGDLGDSLNILTQRIRSNMDELTTYSEKTNEINLEIQKRVFVLSNLLQISSLITQGVSLDNIIKLTIEKSRLLADSETAYLLFREEEEEIFSVTAADGLNAEHLLKLKVTTEGTLFDKIIHTHQPLTLDKDNSLSDNLAVNFYEKFGLKNTLALPVVLRKKVIAILGIGNNREGFAYKKDNIDLLDIFAKQITIAVENDRLLHRIEKLEIKDALTGLYNYAFICNSLQSEIKRAIAYQRPCAFVLIDIDDFANYQNNFGSLQTEAALKKMAHLIKGSVTEIDQVARFGDNEFAIVLPEKTKRQAKEIAEEIRKKIEFAFKEEQDTKKRITASSTVSENPLDGVESKELIDRAKELISDAKKQGGNKVLS